MVQHLPSHFLFLNSIKLQAPEVSDSQGTGKKISNREPPMRTQSRDLAVSALALLVALSVASLCRAQNSAEDYLDAHNAARAEVGVSPIQWDAGVEAYALGYARKRSVDCALIHSGGPYGENIYVGYGDGYSWGTDALRWWYDEKPHYNYDRNACSAETGCLHYRQMIWRNSVRLGCARAECANGSFFITCNYDPPGNVWGERPY